MSATNKTSVAQRVVMVLSLDPMGVNEVVQRTGANPNTLRKVIPQLVKAGTIRQDESGALSLPGTKLSTLELVQGERDSDTETGARIEALEHDDGAAEADANSKSAQQAASAKALRPSSAHVFALRQAYMGTMAEADGDMKARLALAGDAVRKLVATWEPRLAAAALHRAVKKLNGDSESLLVTLKQIANEIPANHRHARVGRSKGGGNTFTICRRSSKNSTPCVQITLPPSFLVGDQVRVMVDANDPSIVIIHHIRKNR